VQDVNILPKLNLQDLIPRKRMSPSIIEDFTQGNRRLKYFHVPIENEIHFYKFVFNFKNLEFDINDKLTLWNFLLNKGIGTKSHTYKELSSKLGEFTAGFYSGTSFGPDGTVNVVLGITCLKKNKEELFKLIEEIIFDPVFEE
jgi:Zn-dependent M16 (insulinase) family peptidase